ncbi:MAG TPA: LamG-like jellyroll fold domain-containing protein [Thermoanaerobaculia bacterium]|jgi:hypothetical protein|nr:LamG-like jellyroll fold domain-containing protein [Thermoanaerobaculia bacterium]
MRSTLLLPAVCLVVSAWLLSTLSAQAATQSCSYPYGVDADTVALWHFDDADTGGPSAADATGFHTAEVHGTPSVSASPYGRAWQLAGQNSGQYLSVPDAPDLDGFPQVTVEEWFYPMAAPIGRHDLVGKGQHTGSNPPGVSFQYELGTLTDSGDPQHIQYTFFLGQPHIGANVGVDSPVKHELNQWHYVAATYDGQRIRLYVNGVLEAQSAVVPNISVSNSNPVWINTLEYPIGSNMFNENGGVAGIIDEIRISRRARSDVEIATAHAARECGAIASLSIAPIASPVAVGTPFPITVTALDDAGNSVNRNGQVELAVSGARVSPNRLPFTHGIAAGNVSVDAPGEQLVLSARAAGRLAFSNPFTATGGSVSGSGYLRVRIRNALGEPQNQLRVTLTRNATGGEYSLFGGVQGIYNSLPVPAGAYQLRAEYLDSSIALRPTPVTIIPGGRPVVLEVWSVHCPIGAEATTPILIVPGFAGSSTANCPGMLLGGSVPRMPPSSPAFDDPAWGIFDEELLTGPGMCSPWGLTRKPGEGPEWTVLRDTLRSRNAAYDVGCYLFPVPWDWRLELEEARKQYLSKWIDRAKAVTGATKVHIITHSTGAILARSYITSTDYADDVDKLALVAPPNQGVAQMYWARQGGEIERLACETDTPFYRVLLRDQIQTVRGTPPECRATRFCRTQAPGVPTCTCIPCDPAVHLGCVEEANWNPLACRAEVQDFLQNDVQSTQGLLPTFSLNPTDPSNVLTNDTNELLTCLNACEQTTGPSPSACGCDDGSRLVPGQSGIETKVRTMLFLGDGETTIERIHRRPTPSGLLNLGLYPDGAPLDQSIGSFSSRVTVKEGDGTVLTESALIPGRPDLNAAANVKVALGTHLQTVGRLSCEIADFLLGPGGCPDQRVSSAASSHELVGISLDGRAQFLVSNRLGARTGVDPSTMEVAESLPDSSLKIDGGNQEVGITDPADDNLDIVVHSTWDEQYRFSLSYDVGGQQASVDYLGFVRSAAPSSFELQVDHSATPPVRVIREPSPPTELRLETYPDGGELRTRVAWTPSSSSGVSHYVVYARSADAPNLSEIASTSSTFVNTGIPWSRDYGDVTYYFAVSAVTNSGDESFLIGQVANDDQDGDGLSDTEELVIGTSVTVADTDNDGLGDGDEVPRGTNPLVQDTDGDGYLDGSEVTSGSDPLDPLNIPTPLSSGFETGDLSEWSTVW